MPIPSILVGFGRFTICWIGSNLPPLISIPVELATMEDLELVHTPTHIKKVLKTAEQTHTSLAPDTPACARTYLSAWLAVGGCLRGIDALMSGQCGICFCLVRPPGHHALSDRAGGFCIFNNLGIAARYAIQNHGLRRILIIDWDIHHGNGLQDLFYDEKRVCYLSSHDILLYPYSGNIEETGQGAGTGYTINLPLSRHLEDADVIHIYQRILEPLMHRYAPELILVAAGFDAHRDDPIGRSRMTAEGFGGLSRLLMKLRAEIDHPPVLLSLEGGYNRLALADSVRRVFDALLSPEDTTPFPGSVSSQAEELVEQVQRIHQNFDVW